MHVKHRCQRSRLAAMLRVPVHMTLPCLRHQHSFLLRQGCYAQDMVELRMPLVPICGGLQRETGWLTTDQKI